MKVLWKVQICTCSSTVSQDLRGWVVSNFLLESGSPDSGVGTEVTVIELLLCVKLSPGHSNMLSQLMFMVNL